MPTLQVRVSSTTHTAIRDIAGRTGEPMQSVLDKAVEEYRRKLFFEELNAAYARIQESPELWEEELGERREWDATLLDGLTDD